MTEDPELGLNTPISIPGVTIDLGKFGDILSKMTPIAGLEDIIDLERE